MITLWKYSAVIFKNFKGLTLERSNFVRKYVRCTAGYISTNNNQSCGKNLQINYKSYNVLAWKCCSGVLLKIFINKIFLQQYVQLGHIMIAEATDAWNVHKTPIRTTMGKQAAKFVQGLSTSTPHLQAQNQRMTVFVSVTIKVWYQITSFY